MCKTLRKSFVCKELKFEKDGLVENILKGVTKLFLKCNDKCKAKQKKLEVKESDDENEEKSHNENKSMSRNLKYSILGSFILLISILVYYFLNL